MEMDLTVLFPHAADLTDEQCEKICYYYTREGSYASGGVGWTAPPGIGAAEGTNHIPGIIYSFDKRAGRRGFVSPSALTDRHMSVLRQPQNIALINIPKDKGGFGGDWKLARMYFLRALHEIIRGNSKYGSVFQPCAAPVPREPYIHPDSSAAEKSKVLQAYERELAEATDLSLSDSPDIVTETDTTPEPKSPVPADTLMRKQKWMTNPSQA